jgi:hypothetical protein
MFAELRGRMSREEHRLGVFENRVLRRRSDRVVK